jgi:hypothetical protein
MYLVAGQALQRPSGKAVASLREPKGRSCVQLQSKTNKCNRRIFMFRLASHNAYIDVSSQGQIAGRFSIIEPPNSYLRTRTHFQPRQCTLTLPVRWRLGTRRTLWLQSWFMKVEACWKLLRFWRRRLTRRLGWKRCRVLDRWGCL